MSRSVALDLAAEYFDSGAFLADLTRRVALPTETGASGHHADLLAYLEQEMVPAVRRLGATTRLLENPDAAGGPLLIGHRHEADGLPTVLTYGHADVVLAEAHRWRAGLDPWRLMVEHDRWYGRGTADNKGQHSINLAALEQVLRARDGRLGFNLKIVIETSEESGSPGLAEVCARHADELAADVLIASDGPRVAADRPTVFLGSRGSAVFTLRVPLRERSYHSGNWGGLLRNLATVLAGALACLVDGQGRILVPDLRPPPIPAAVREALRTIPVGGDPGDPDIDRDWGEPGLTPAERLIGWNTLEVLTLGAGNPDAPVGAIPGSATRGWRIASCGSWWKPTPRAWPGPCVTTWTSTASAWSGSNRDRLWRPPASTRMIRGSGSSSPRWNAPRVPRRPCCPIWAVPCSTPRSPADSACPQSGSRTPTRPAPSTPPTSTCSRRWPVRPCG